MFGPMTTLDERRAAFLKESRERVERAWSDFTTSSDALSTRAGQLSAKLGLVDLSRMNEDTAGVALDALRSDMDVKRSRFAMEFLRHLDELHEDHMRESDALQQRLAKASLDSAAATMLQAENSRTANRLALAIVFLSLVMALATIAQVAIAWRSSSPPGEQASKK